MSKEHGQIVHYDDEGNISAGRWRTMPVEEAPKAVVQLALKAANLVGSGLYGVDVKQNERGVFVIEINDNPNIEAAVEDGHLKDKLYEMILGEFVRRLDARVHILAGAPPDAVPSGVPA